MAKDGQELTDYEVSGYGRKLYRWRIVSGQPPHADSVEVLLSKTQYDEAREKLPNLPDVDFESSSEVDNQAPEIVDLQSERYSVGSFSDVPIDEQKEWVSVSPYLKDGLTSTLDSVICTITGNHAEEHKRSLGLVLLLNVVARPVEVLLTGIHGLFYGILLLSSPLAPARIDKAAQALDDFHQAISPVKPVKRLLNESYQRIHDNNRLAQSPHQDLLANARIETSAADYFSIKPSKFLGNVFRREVPASHIDKSSTPINSYKQIGEIIEYKGDAKPHLALDLTTLSRTSCDETRQRDSFETSFKVDGKFLHSKDNPNQPLKENKPMNGDPQDELPDDKAPPTIGL